MGEVAFGRYRVRARLGEGGAGLVLRATDTELDRDVAIKLVRSGAAGSDGSEARRRLVREAEAIARVSHPNVVAVFDVGQYSREEIDWPDDTIPAHGVYLVMEWVDGTDLHRWIEDRRPPVAQLRRVFGEAAAGLVAVHRHGLVHRDFKPANVLVGRDGRVKIADFGLARVRGDSSSDGDEPGMAPASASGSGRLTTTGTVMGTPLYMAPEQHRGVDVDARADQYAFCLALWEALDGYPFPSEDPKQLVRAKHAVALPTGRATMPPTLRRALVRGLARDPAARWPDMAQLQAVVVGRRRRYWPAAMLAVGGIGVFGVLAWPSADVSTCQMVAGTELASVWDGRRAARVIEAVANRGVGSADAHVALVGQPLTEYAIGWQSIRGEICEKSRADATAWAAARACLSRSLDSFEGVLRVVESAQGPDAVTAGRLIADLPWAEACARRSGEVPQAVSPEVAALRSDLAETSALREIGETKAAANRALALVATATEIGDPRVVAEAIEIHGSTLESDSRFDEARAVLERAFHVAQEAGHDRVIFDAALELAFLDAFRRSQPGPARTWLRHAQAVIERTDASDDLGARWHHMAAIVAEESAEFEAALEHHDESVALARGWFGPDHPRTLRYLGARAGSLTEAMRYREAKPAYRSLLERQVAVLGPNHPDVASTVNNLGAAYINSGQSDEAEPLLERAYEIRKGLYGPDHPVTAAALGQLGVLWVGQGKHERALEAFTHALRAARARYGDEGRKVAGAYSRLGAVLMRMGRVSEAREHLQRAYEIAQRVRGPDDPKIAIEALNYAEALRRTGDLEQASRRAQQVLDVLAKAGQPGVASAAWAHQVIGLVHLDAGRHAEAADSLRTSVTTYEAAGVRGRRLGSSSLGLARALWEMGHRDQARAAARRTVDEIDDSQDERQQEAEQWLRAHP